MKKNDGNAKGAHKQRTWLPTVKVTDTALIIAFALLSIWLLAVNGANLLRKIELLSYFAPTGMYLHDCLGVPGGLMVYVSTFLTQTFYHPWLGAVVYTALLLSLGFVSFRACRLSGGLRPLALLLPSSVLLALLSLGYTIFSLKSPGYAFNLPLGLIAAFLAVWGYRHISPWWMRSVAIAIVASAGYCLTGFYGLLATAMCMAIEMVRMFTGWKRDWWQPLVPVAIGALAIWAVPEIWFGCIGRDLILKQVYLCPLPLFIEGEGALWWPYNLLIALSIVFAALSAFNISKEIAAGQVLRLAGILLAIGGMVSVVALKNDDPNLRLSLTLDHAMQQGDWDGAIAAAKAAQDIEPTRVNVVLTDLALLRKGCLGDSLFKFRIASAPYETARSTRATHDIISRMFTYHTGLSNFAYRMGMEYKVEYGTSVEQLQFMAKAALLNGDTQLARKALDNLRLTAFHKGWADKYYRYVEHPELMAEDPEFKSIMPLLTKYDGFMTDRGRMESFIWNFLASTPNSNKESLELALCGALISQDMAAFGQVLPYYAAKADGKLPVHIQEGVLAWQSIDDNFDIRPYHIDDAVMKRFNEFMDASHMYSKFGQARQKEMLHARFGDTFWFYYLFVEGLIIY